MGTRADELQVTSSVPVKLPELRRHSSGGSFAPRGRSLSFTISGAVALQQHTGICRYTKDLTTSSLAPLTRTRHSQFWRGRDSSAKSRIQFGSRRHDVTAFFVDLITGMSNGAITVDAEWIKRSHPAVVLGVETRVLAPEIDCFETLHHAA